MATICHPIVVAADEQRVDVLLPRPPRVGSIKSLQRRPF